MLLAAATVLSAPYEIYKWSIEYPWWWTVNAIGAYGTSLVGLYGVFIWKKWGFWLSVGSTLAVPLFLRPTDPTLTTVSGAFGYISLYAIVVGLYWFAIIKRWNHFS